MRTAGKVLLLYWGVYALDFLTSVLFIALGYGFAESNQAQRALVASPGIATLVPWALNQGVWIGMGVFGTAVFAFSEPLAREMYVAPMLGFLSAIRLFGVASNVGFTVFATTGVPLFPAACYALLSVPILLSLRKELRFGNLLAVLKR